jgi:predicted dehydrogenase
MKKFLVSLLSLGLPLAAQEYKIAVVGLVHSHVWGHLGRMVAGEQAKLVGIAETEPELIEAAKKRGATNVTFYSDYKKMLDETRPDIVWAFVENNRHLEIVQACAPRKINVVFEKPLASSYKDALAIQKLARQHGIQVMTNYQMAWWPANYAAKAAVDAGDIGKIYRLRGIVGHGGPGAPTGTNKYFVAWLYDPVKNGAGALMDFGCYNALWSLWYKGRPDTVYTTVQHLRPDLYPKVEDNATMVLSYKDAVGIFEGSWNLPRSFQDLEIYSHDGSVYLKNGKVEIQKGKEVRELPLTPLPKEQSEPIAFMVNSLRNKKPIEGLTALDINVGVVEIIEAAKMSLATGKAVPLPLH